VDALQRLSMEWLRVIENTRRSDEDFAPLKAMADKYCGTPSRVMGKRFGMFPRHAITRNVYRMD